MIDGSRDHRPFRRPPSAGGGSVWWAPLVLAAVWVCPAGPAAASSTVAQAGGEGRIEVGDEAVGPATDDFARSVQALAELDLADLLNMNVEVVSATKTATKAAAVAAAITVLKGEEMIAWGYTSLAEALQHQVGFFVVDDFVLPNVGVRGIAGSMWGESGTIKVMIDGHSVAFRSTGGNWLGPELIPLTAISHIEIIRGPASSLYGADAFLALINIVTRSAAEKSEGTVRGGPHLVGRRFGSDIDGAVVSKVGPVQILAAGRFHQSDLSDVRLPKTSPAPVVPAHHTGSRQVHGLEQQSGVGLLKLSYDSAPVTATLSGYISTLERGAELSPWLQLGNGLDEAGRMGINRVALAHGNIAATVGLELSETASLKLDCVYFQGGPTPRDRIEVGNDTFFARRRFGFRGVDATLEGHWNPLANLRLVGGAVFLFDHEQQPSVLKELKSASPAGAAGSVVESASLRQGAVDLWNPAGFLSAQWQPWDRLLGLQGSVRVDYHNIYGMQVAGRVGAVSEPIDHLAIKLMYGGAFKAPSPLLLYAQPLRPGDIIGNPELRAQYAHTVELQASYVFVEAVRVETGVEITRLLDKAEFRQEGANKIARNISAMDALAWETSVEGHFDDWLSGYARLTVTAAERRLDEGGYAAWLLGTKNVGFPPVILAMGLHLTPPWPVRATVEGRYLGARRAQDTNLLERGRDYRLPPTFILDATVTYLGLRLFGDRQTTLGLVGRNLLGDATPEPGFAGVDYPRAPRTVLFTLSQDL